MAKILIATNYTREIDSKRQAKGKTQVINLPLRRVQLV